MDIHRHTGIHKVHPILLDVNVGLQTLTDKVEALTKEVEDAKLLINNLTLGSLDLRSSLETELRHLEQVVEDTKDTTNSLERKVESLDNKIMDQGQGTWQHTR